ncbi:glucosidase 2 subunit beta-like isoform X1 [Cynara cardunculus var. scolymus]|uniref:glucosidase 2 subunit beta-like isoform X1 n=1 Tax=Cynara cardunculus var. scolymus TaxID=59895 RepID=UPI000D63114C|nr:glucosidase 2 subunit beta-like isoform X1 [Cynara cardunculus var. scolymus]XP_024974371.1 glucosidase 2 subunit beta-like isoform X1 [Cynara cardunculus var. scolymus]
MKMKIQTQSYILLVFYSMLVLRSAVVLSENLLGVAPQDEEYYKGLSSSGTIICKDGSKTFTTTQLNDDFCDCSDGTDEPGTSACPSGKFYCRNAGHTPLSIFSSRVNDGICDCCDGSDEYNGKIKCKNTCWEAGKVARDRLTKKIATFKEGVIIRKHEVEQAKILAAKDEAELSRLKNEENILKGLVQQLKERKEQIEKAQEKERIQKEKEEKQKKEAEEATVKEQKGEEIVNVQEQEYKESKSDDDARIHNHPPSGQDPNKGAADPGVSLAHDDDDDDDDKDASVHNIEEHAEKNEESSKVAHEHDPSHGSGSKEEDASENAESSSREELGRAIGSRWTGKKAEQWQDEDAGTARNNDDNEYDETSDTAHEEEDSGYDTETEEDHQHHEEDDNEDQMDDVGGDEADDDSSEHKYESDDEMEDMEGTSPSWLEKIQQTVRDFLQAVNPFQTPVDTSESESVRKEYDDASGKLSKIQSRISSLTKKLGHDFGPEKEFYSLYGRCFEIKENKYVYKVCPFKEASQLEGHSTTHLGHWDKFEESYRIMLFSTGDKCWNGPYRSLTVRLRCGSKVEVSDIDEPSRCEYAALLTTPALCLEERLKELEDKLEAMNKEQPEEHDEL